jgi:hypothetical protein
VVNLEQSEGAVQIFGPGAAATPLPSVDLGAPEDWMNALSKTGTYEIAVRTPSKKPYDLRVTLIDPHDPRLDPGVTPGQVSLDLGALGGKVKLALEPFRPLLTGDIDEPWPANLWVQNDRVEFRIMSLDGLRKRMAIDKNWIAPLGRLETALRPGGKALAPEMMPPGNSEAALLFGAREEYVEGPSVRALRYIGQFAQDTFAPSNPLTYILFGVSRDGKYFVVLRGEISHPSLPKRETYMAEGPKLKALQAEAARRLTAQPAESFQPGLSQLDGIIRSLRLP